MYPDQYSDPMVFSFGSVESANLDGSYSVSASGDSYSMVPNASRQVYSGSAVTMLNVNGNKVILGVGGYTSK